VKNNLFFAIKAFVVFSLCRRNFRGNLKGKLAEPEIQRDRFSEWFLSWEKPFGVDFGETQVCSLHPRHPWRDGFGRLNRAWPSGK
ncbi:uncharacterized protein METZ01_LOCUS190666, partial [marine metagenome]